MALLERTSEQEIWSMYEAVRLPYDAPDVEKLRTLFYVVLEHGRRHSWVWGPAQSDHKRLLTTEARVQGKVGNSIAFCKLLVFLAEKEREEEARLEEEARKEAAIRGRPMDPAPPRFIVDGYGDPNGAWVAKPSTCGIDPNYRGNIVGPGGKLTGYAVLPRHTVLRAYGRIFDLCLGWEHDYPGKTKTDWLAEFRAHRVHCTFNAKPVHFAVWETKDVAAWSDVSTLMSVEWPPGDEEALRQALTKRDGTVDYERLDSDKGKMLLALTYRFMHFAEEEALRAVRIESSGWYLWHDVDLDQVIAREEAEAKAAAREAKRQAQLDRIHGKTPKGGGKRGKTPKAQKK